MNKIGQKIKSWLKGECYLPNKDAAELIDKFVSLPREGNTENNAYAWDDFETIEHLNKEVELALWLCWHFADKFPARHHREYMAPEGSPYFKRIAALLRKGKLAEYSSLDLEKVKQGDFPEDLRKLLDMREVHPGKESAKRPNP